MLIDLTLPIDEQDKNNPFFNHKDGINVARLGHLGTHLDIMNAANLDINRFIGTAKIVHVENIFGREIEPADFENTTDIQKGDFMIFKTDWLPTYYETDFYVTGHPQSGHPELSDTTLEYLIQKEVNFIGIDAAGVKRKEGHRKADMYCADHNIFVIENIINLNQLQQDTFKFYCFPLPLKHSSGLPVRLLAEI
ncbi:cyclase family protein [Pelosinus propionicus]|uniref:Kynurenine formamidase n=1 Tax=Pelosinus propionicus DSM 13327 TaxID=1123291 RepID=A0A1I4NXA7_9FIRM|nr:cyclase family protein [Pelosinus propionicus]SFM20099.1 Kynurenine formamidase [Pelosinus propionicus DSM 13327]